MPVITTTKTITRQKSKRGTLPCSLCGLSNPIRLNSHKEARYCLIFRLYLYPDEISDAHSDTRKKCRSNGDYFVWPLKGVNSIQLLEWRIKTDDWYIGRKAARTTIKTARIGVVIAVLSILMSGVGLLLKS